jgi:hypothetical protein
MKPLPVTLLLLLTGACQPEARRLLLVDMTLADPLVVQNTATPWHEAGYRVEYRQFYPHLTRADLRRYRAVILLGGREPEAPSDALTIGDLAILNEWIRRDGVVILGYASEAPAARGRGQDGTLDRWVMNRWLASQGAGIAIGTESIESPASPVPHSALDNAGFAPFPAGHSRALQVRDRSQVLARAPASALIAASRVQDGLVVVASRSLLSSASENSRTREFLVELARWTRRPAEWAHIRPATHPVPLRLANAPRPVVVHPPPLQTPEGVAPITLPVTPRSGSARGADDESVDAPGWIARQGMRVLWSRFTPQSLDSLLAFVDIAALNALATVVPVGALTDTLAMRNIWRVTAERMQSTSVHWFPGVSLYALASQSSTIERIRARRAGRLERAAAQEAGVASEVNRHGELMPVACGLDSLFWRETFRPAQRTLARLGGARPDVITGVALDLDSAATYYRGGGFCDADFRIGLAGLGLDSADLSSALTLPPAVRYDTLLERGWLERYFSALETAVAERARALRGDLRRLNPDLRFAFHASEVPADWFSRGLMRGFSTPDAPVLLWVRERRTRELLRHYRAREIYGLAAIRLEPDRATLAPAEAARLRARVFTDGAGFWLDGATTDSLGRVLRRFVR